MSKNINEALKNLFLELGGNGSALADNSKISDYIDDLADVLSPEPMIVTVSAGAVDKTFAEIKSAFEAGKNIHLVDGDNVANIVGILKDSDIYAKEVISFVCFYGYQSSGTTIVYETVYSIDEDETFSSATARIEY